MGGPNLEVFKFGMYIMFPIGIMYYFGTNLDGRFKVPDFWPKEGQSHKIPFEKGEIEQELERLKARRLALREQRLQAEALAARDFDDDAVGCPVTPTGTPMVRIPARWSLDTGAWGR